MLDSTTNTVIKFT